MGPAGRLLTELEAEQPRWFLWVPVMFGFGIGLYFALPTEPAGLLAAGLVALASAFRITWRPGGMASLLPLALLAVALGFGAAKARSDLVGAPILAAPLRNAELRGWVELVEPKAGDGERLTLRVISIAGMPSERLPYRVRVRTLSGDGSLSPGDLVRVTATLSPPAPPAFPGSYDFARQAWFLAIGAVGYSRRPARSEATAEPRPADLAVRAAIERVRQAIGRRVVAALPGETGQIAMALITGERNGITEATNTAFRDSGLLHILSISGLHMVIMAGAVFFSVRQSLAALPSIALRYPIKKWAAAAAAAAALAYLLISGASFATVRSYIMISIMFLAVLLDRPAVALRNVAVTALVILAIWPESLLDVGFQMSFAAVVGLISAYEMIRDRPQPERRGAASVGLGALLFVGGIILTTLIASITVAPFAAFHFHKSQQYAILANLIAIPVCNAIVMPAALATLLALPLGLEAWPLWVMGKGIEMMVWCAYAVAGLPGAVGRVPAIPTHAFLAMVAGGLWIALWRRRWRLAGLVAVVAGMLLAPWQARPDLIVGREARLVAVRMSDGRLAVTGPRSAAFEIQRWLETDGDGRTVDEAFKTTGFDCDGAGCIAKIAGGLIAMPQRAAALRDDCARASILIVPGAVRRGCAADRIIIDGARVGRLGTHALYREAGGTGEGRYRIETVADARGDRPWSRQPSARPAPRVGSVPSRPPPPIPGSDQPQPPVDDIE